MSMRSTFRTMHRAPSKGSLFDKLIDPIDRLSETIFSILILLTFTLAFQIIRLSDSPSYGSAALQMDDLLIGALGAIFAWGIIDGAMYALMSVFERGESHRLLQNIRAAENEQEAVDLIAADLDYILEPISEKKERQIFYTSVLDYLKDSQPRTIKLTGEDLIGAAAHVMVAILAVLPSLIPLFLVRGNDQLAIRISNLVSFILLFIAGYRWGKYTGINPLRTGLVLMTIAVVMVLVAILLGG